MPTIRILLDRYGPPPPEVALDWSWQIAQSCAASSQAEQSCLISERSWTDLEVGDDGQLLCEILTPGAARTAINDLRMWVNVSSAQCAPRDSATTDSIESPQFAQAITAEQSLNSDASSGLSSGLSTTPLSSLSSLPSSLQSSLPGNQRKISTQAPSKRRTATWIVGAMCGVVCLAIACLVFSSSSDKVEVSRNTASNEVGSRNNASENEAVPAAVQLDSNLVDAASQIAPLSNNGLDAMLDSSLDTTTNSSLGALKVDASLSAFDRQSSGAMPSQFDDDKVANAGNEQVTAAASANGSADDLSEVTKTLRAAESEEPVDVAALKPAKTKESASGSSSDSSSGSAHISGEPWVLTRDTMRYRVDVPAKLNVNSKQSQWTLALEPIAGLVVQPASPVTIQAHGIALWRIYDPEAKPPRAGLVVRARHLGREGKMELMFCGGSEDLPAISVPLAQRWMEPLTVRVQSQTLELRGALARLSTTVITPEQVVPVMQRKQTMIAQMATCARLSVVMPEINRLAELADGQVTMHAALKSKPDEPPVATWGRLAP